MRTSAFDMGWFAAYLLVGYIRLAMEAIRVPSVAYVRSYYKCVQLVGEA